MPLEHTYHVSWTCACNRTHNDPIHARGTMEALIHAVRRCDCGAWRKVDERDILEAFWDRELDVHNILEER